MVNLLNNIFIEISVGQKSVMFSCVFNAFTSIVLNKAKARALETDLNDLILAKERVTDGVVSYIG